MEPKLPSAVKQCRPMLTRKTGVLSKYYQLPQDTVKGCLKHYRPTFRVQISADLIILVLLVLPVLWQEMSVKTKRDERQPVVWNVSLDITIQQKRLYPSKLLWLLFHEYSTNSIVYATRSCLKSTAPGYLTELLKGYKPTRQLRSSPDTSILRLPLCLVRASACTQTEDEEFTDT